MKKAVLILMTLVTAAMGFGFAGCGEEPVPPKPAEKLDETTRNVFVASDASAGGTGTQESPFRSLEEARDYVRIVKDAESRNIKIYLRGGTYSLDETFTLTEADSAPDGKKITYLNYPNEVPTLSGGRKVENWRFVNGVYETAIEPGLNIRNLFVNGERKTRAREKGGVAYLTMTDRGFSVGEGGTLKNLPNFENISDVELCSINSWKLFRVGVDHVEGRDLIIGDAQWKSARATSDLGMKNVAWVENAYELMNEPGEWYYNRETGKIYYIPEEGEKLRSSEVVVPVTNCLVKFDGDLANKLQNIEMTGLTFAYDAWDEVETMGYIEHQAGVIQNGPGWFDMYKTPGGVIVSASKNVRISGCNFTHMGVNGITVVYGSTDVEVTGNTFSDISAAGISIADIQGTDPRQPDVDGAYYDHHPSDARRIVERIKVENNTVSGIGAEYYSNCGISVGYARNISILHNTLFDLPYTGISVGWGWGYPDTFKPDSPQSVCENNVVKGNLIYDYMKKMNDGGGIYTLGESRNSEISENYIASQKNEYSYIYLDNGSSGYTIKNNVIDNEYDGKLGACNTWALISTFIGGTDGNPECLNAYGNDLRDNWYAFGMSIFQEATWKDTNTKSGNVAVQDRNWSAEARTVMENAGAK